MYIYYNHKNKQTTLVNIVGAMNRLSSLFYEVSYRL